MKVILKGINPELLNEEGDEFFQHNLNLLKQVPYPLETIAEDTYPNVVYLYEYINDPIYTESSQKWGLKWFDYEEIKD